MRTTLTLASSAARWASLGRMNGLGVFNMAVMDKISLEHVSCGKIDISKPTFYHPRYEDLSASSDAPVVNIAASSLTVGQEETQPS